MTAPRFFMSLGLQLLLVCDKLYKTREGEYI